VGTTDDSRLDRGALGVRPSALQDPGSPGSALLAVHLLADLALLPCVTQETA
jgi:hypothetical protein